MRRISTRVRIGAAVSVLLLVAAASSGCSSSADANSAVSQALTETLTQIRAEQGEPLAITLPGVAAAALTKSGDKQILSSEVSGPANPPGDTPLLADERFHIGSLTKTFTAALIMQLDQAGQLSLSDPISTWLDYPGGENITVEMLLGHTSGLPDFSEMSGQSRTATPQESIALAATGTPLFAPGSEWAYSNTNYTMLGVIAEEVTGKPWADEVQQRFFEPLGLSNTYVWQGTEQPPTADGSRLSCGEEGEPKCVQQPGFTVLPVTDGFDWTVAWSAGAVVSTPADVVTWMQALVVGDVLDAEHRQLMTTPTPQSQAALAQLPPYGSLTWTGAGLGLLQYEIAGQGVGWGHSGGINGFTSNAVHMTNSGQTVAVTSNFQQTETYSALGALVTAVSNAAGS